MYPQHLYTNLDAGEKTNNVHQDANGSIARYSKD